MTGTLRAPNLLSRLRRCPREGAIPVDPLVGRHFLIQDERPSHVEPVPVDQLDPFLRNLLFTDGTVTRSLAVQTLAPVSVERVAQAEVAVPAWVGDQLEIEAGAPSIRRRVSIGTGSPRAMPLLWAESHLLPERLPPGFVGLLDGAPDGIGQSLQRVSLESYRELLWFGFDAAPEWAGAPPVASRGTIRRLYRIVSARQAAILISESFVVEQCCGLYRLAGLGTGTATDSRSLGEAE